MSSNPNPSQSPPPQSGEGGEAETMSLLSGVARADDLPDADGLDPETAGSRMSTPTLVMAGVVVIAAAMLWMMRPSSSGASTSDPGEKASARIQQALVELDNPQAMSRDSAVAPGNLKALFSDTDSVIQMLSADYTDQQVPVRFIKKNPFQMEKVKPTPKKTDSGEAGRQAKLKQLRSAFARLELKSVMGGATPVAIIDGELYEAGAKVGPFQIQAIHSSRMEVTLTAEGEQFHLRMSRDSTGP